jgi:hypothetical protein
MIDKMKCGIFAAKIFSVFMNTSLGFHKPVVAMKYI